MDSKAVKEYFESESVLGQYAEAAKKLGLWQSEEKILTRVFKPEATLLELGCGAGRIAFGLHELGYKNILATDYSKEMIRRARHLAKLLEYSVPFRAADATELEFEDNVFDGAIFGFNGLMQIPKKEQREQALKEIFRVIRPGAWFVFTTHDREHSEYRDFWLEEEQRWKAGQQSKELDDFGDRFQITDDGMYFIHIPTLQEMEAVLNHVGFRIEATVLRSEIATESREVDNFSDECRFWVVQKPELSI
ncbi:MAG: ubiquinone/menaquinone biosynthesis C-methylase UbiE [Zhongshania aliphaticivorans]|jgi:ubiquinone/menaquinone biosynthesis C-methylase UbiE